MNDMLENYKEHSVDYKFEANLREGEIRQFAKDVLPEARFLFDNYKVQTDLFKQQPNEASEVKAEDYFSFFSSHEKIILKPESSFKSLRTFLVDLPIDYYILLQSGY
jgi:hypothetical protein